MISPRVLSTLLNDEKPESGDLVAKGEKLEGEVDYTRDIRDVPTIRKKSGLKRL